VSCVTPADLGKPLAAIVERCGSPDEVMSLSTSNALYYSDGGHLTSISFDADQMRARMISFTTISLPPTQPPVVWNVMLPFESGAREIALGQMTLADAQSALVADADVTTRIGAAFRSTTPHNDVVLAARTSDRVVVAAFVGEHASLAQSSYIDSPLDEKPLDYMAPAPRDAWLRPQNAAPGPRATIFRIDVDAVGTVRDVTIVIASGDAAFDAATQQRLGDARFRAATLDNRPVSGTCFVQVRH